MSFQAPTLKSPNLIQEEIVNHGNFSSEKLGDLQIPSEHFGIGKQKEETHIYNYPRGSNHTESQKALEAVIGELH